MRNERRSLMRYAEKLAKGLAIGLGAVFLMSCAGSAGGAEASGGVSAPAASDAASPKPAPAADAKPAVSAPATNAHPVTIVVLGSSSPAGKNIYKLFNRPKTEEQQYADKYNWVTLYDARLKTFDTQNRAVNLAAASGHSTSIALKEKKGGPLYRNSLDYALQTYPQADAMIVNFPAIRGQEGETVASVVANLEEIEKRALAAGVGKVWIATAQPAANKTECFKNETGACDATLTIYQSRIDLTNAIIAAFPGRSLDFHTPLAKGGSRTGVADPAFLNPIDKLHPNLEGHEKLLDAVIAAGVYEQAAKN